MEFLRRVPFRFFCKYESRIFYSENLLFGYTFFNEYKFCLQLNIKKNFFKNIFHVEKKCIFAN